MIILLGRVAVTLDVTDNLAVDLAGGVETEGGLDPLVLQVAVDGLGDTDHLYVGAYVLVIFGKNGSVGIGVVTADDYQRLDIELLQNLKTAVELIGIFQLGTA